MGKRLGQHFLESKRYLRRIAGALELEPGDTVVEIGPGHGELTREVIKQLGNSVNEKIRIIAIEKDGELFKKLSDNSEFKNKVEFVHGNVLEILPKLIRNLKLEIRNSNYKIVGNIPFYLTGRLLRVISELEPKPKLTVLTIQQEVAERLCAQPPKMNLLAAAVQIWAKPEIVGCIPRSSFSPAPKVDSAIIKLVPTFNYSITQLPNYYRLIKILFKQPRKTILNNLIKADLDAYIQINDRRFVYKLHSQPNQPVKDASYNEMGQKKRRLVRNLEKMDIDPTDRPQDLSVGTIIKLSEMWYTQNQR